MPAIEEAQIYRDLMRFKPEHLTPNAWAIKAGVSRAVWADMRRHGNPSRRTLEKLLTAAGSSLAEFEALRVGDEPVVRTAAAGGFGDPKAPAWTPAQLPPLPLIAAHLAGELSTANVALIEICSDEILERLPRPISLASDPNAYAVTVVVESMWPRFRPGRRVAVSPRSAVAVGDDVLVRLRSSPDSGTSGEFAVVAELVGRGNHSVELRQFKPDRSFSIETIEIQAMHKVVGELI